LGRHGDIIGSRGTARACSVPRTSAIGMAHTFRVHYLVIDALKQLPATSGFTIETEF
jgi:hypothetical protein